MQRGNLKLGRLNSPKDTSSWFPRSLPRCQEIDAARVAALCGETVLGLPLAQLFYGDLYCVKQAYNRKDFLAEGLAEAREPWTRPEGCDNESDGDESLESELPEITESPHIIVNATHHVMLARLGVHRLMILTKDNTEVLRTTKNIIVMYISAHYMEEVRMSPLARTASDE